MSSASAVVFGENDMASYSDDSSTLLEQEMSRPVAAMIHISTLEDTINGIQQTTLSEKIWEIFKTPNHGKTLCPNLKFAEEEAIGTCSGVLVAPDLIATAAHCLWAGEISEYAWVFNYTDSNNIDQNKIYRAKEVVLKKDSIIKWDYSEGRKLFNEERKRLGLSPLGPDIMDFSGYQDIAVIRLEKAVIGVKPAEIDDSIQGPGTPLTIIGHPFGLSKKIIRNGEVVENLTEMYTTNTLDVVKGNSGGPVFSAETGKLVGLIVNQGKERAFTFDRKNRCYGMASYDENEKNPDSLSGYMNITHISEILP